MHIYSNDRFTSSAGSSGRSVTRTASSAEGFEDFIHETGSEIKSWAFADFLIADLVVLVGSGLRIDWQSSNQGFLIGYGRKSRCRRCRVAVFLTCCIWPVVIYLKKTKNNSFLKFNTSSFATLTEIFLAWFHLVVIVLSFCQYKIDFVGMKAKIKNWKSLEKNSKVNKFQFQSLPFHLYRYS